MGVIRPAFFYCTEGLHRHILQLVGGVEVVKCNLHSRRHGLLSLTYPHAWIEVLLVWLVVSLWVAHRGLQVVLLLEHVVSDTRHVRILEIGVQVDLDHSVPDGLLVLLLGRTGPAVEDKVNWLILRGASLRLDVGLVLGEQLRVKLHVTGLVDTVDITEAGGNGEVRADGR
jgi:hypothetical protein